MLWKLKQSMNFAIRFYLDNFLNQKNLIDFFQTDT